MNLTISSTRFSQRRESVMGTLVLHRFSGLFHKDRWIYPVPVDTRPINPICSSYA